MSRIAIITDTDASLPAHIAEQFGIRLVPITIHFGQETFYTGINIDDASLFGRVDRDGVLPTTAAPSPGAFAEAYAAAFSAGAEQIVCFCVSSEVSATYAAAVAARDTMPDRDITVIDTRSVSMGQGFMVLAAAQAARDGASVSEIIQRAMAVRERTSLYGGLATLKYLAMSGRIGHLAAGLAALLDIKPILTIKDGKLDMLERARTRKKQWARMIELSQQAIQGHHLERLAFLHVNAPNELRAFEQLFREHITAPAEAIVADLTPGLSVHTGAGLIAVAFVVSD